MTTCRSVAGSTLCRALALGSCPGSSARCQISKDRNEPATTRAPQRSHEADLDIAPSLPFFGKTSIPLRRFSVESLVAPYSILALALRAVEAGVGRREQFLRRPSLRIGGDAEARGERDTLPVADGHVECRDRLAQAFRERSRTREVGFHEQD